MATCDAYKNTPAPIHPVIDDYFGTKVVDNYRYMEDLSNPAVQGWIKTQADFTHQLLEQIPGRDAFFRRMIELDGSVSERLTKVFHLENGILFYLKRESNDEVWKLYKRNSLQEEEVLLVDPECFRADTGKLHAIVSFMPSWDGQYVAFGIAVNGSGDATLHVVDTITLDSIDQPIPSAGRYEYYGFWLPDSRAFFYNRCQEMVEGMADTEKYQKSRVYLHRLGTSIDDDILLLDYGTTPLLESLAETPFVTSLPNSNVVLTLILNGTQQALRLFAKPLVSLTDNNIDWREVCNTSDQVTYFDVHGDYIYLLTHKNTPCGKVVKVPLSAPNFSKAEVVLDESRLVLKELRSAKDAVYVQATDGMNGAIIRIPHNGRAETLAFPWDGIAIQLFRNDPRVEGILLSISSWIRYNCIYEYKPETRQFSEVSFKPKGQYDAPEDLVFREIDVRSHDGVMVPLSIIHRRGLQLDGSNPCWLVGYGAYGALIKPFYDPAFYAWFEKRGIAAFAHVRGGGVKGETWYRDGFRQTKPNTWKDFICCAEYLIDQQYTSPEKLGGEGESAGGILIGRAITDRPDLFAVAIPKVGCMNPVRMETTANGVPNIPEFGSCQTDVGFRSLYEMDAYLHIEDGVNYPALLITHGMNDTSVDPWQSAKFAARAQAASASDKPVVLRIDYEAGHGRGRAKAQIFKERADIFAFMMWQFGVEEYQLSD